MKRKLTAEIGMAGGVHHIDAHITAANGCVFGQDGDAALTLDIVRIHNPLIDLFILPESAALPQHGVHQRGLPVIDVRDDRDVPQIVDGKVIPSTLSDINLVADIETERNGAKLVETVRGESTITERNGRIIRLDIVPCDAAANPAALREILSADLIASTTWRPCCA